MGRCGGRPSTATGGFVTYRTLAGSGRALDTLSRGRWRTSATAPTCPGPFEWKTRGHDAPADLRTAPGRPRAGRRAGRDGDDRGAGVRARRKLATCHRRTVCRAGVPATTCAATSTRCCHPSGRGLRGRAVAAARVLTLAAAGGPRRDGRLAGSRRSTGRSSAPAGSTWSRARSSPGSGAVRRSRYRGRGGSTGRSPRPAPAPRLDRGCATSTPTAPTCRGRSCERSGLLPVTTTTPYVWTRRHP